MASILCCYPRLDVYNTCYYYWPMSLGLATTTVGNRVRMGKNPTEDAFVLCKAIAGLRLPPTRRSHLEISTFGVCHLPTDTAAQANSPAVMPPTELNFITGNTNKLAEVQSILGDTVPLRSRSLDLAEIQGSMEDISKDKCRRAADLVCDPHTFEEECCS